MTPFGPGPILVIAPHADDETLACGGLLHARWTAGGRAHVLCLSDGAASHPGSASHRPPRLAALRRRELARAVETLGGVPARDVTALNYPDAALHRVQGPGADIARNIRDTARRIGATTLLAPSAFDPHCDHEAAAEAALGAAKSMPGLRLAWYSVWARWNAGGTPPATPKSTRISVEACGTTKTAAIACHASQMGRVIRDDPDGFSMPPGFAEMFANTPEVFDIAREAV